MHCKTNKAQWIEGSIAQQRSVAAPPGTCTRCKSPPQDRLIFYIFKIGCRAQMKRLSHIVTSMGVGRAKRYSALTRLQRELASGCLCIEEYSSTIWPSQPCPRPTSFDYHWNRNSFPQRHSTTAHQSFLSERAHSMLSQHAQRSDYLPPRHKLLLLDRIHAPPPMNPRHM